MKVIFLEKGFEDSINEINFASVAEAKLFIEMLDEISIEDEETSYEHVITFHPIKGAFEIIIEG